MTMAYEAASVVAMPAEAYGPAADAILSGARPILAQARRGFLQEFFDDAPGIPVSLRDAARGTLQCLQGRMDVHLRQLLEPGSTPEHVELRARRVGEIHTLVGLSASALTQAHSHFRRHLQQALAAAALPAQDLHALLDVVEARLQDNLRAELDIQAEVHERYLRTITSEPSEDGARWVDARRENIQLLGDLPGVLAAALLRLQPDGVFAVEDSAGPRAADLTSNFQNPSLATVVDSLSPQGNGLTAQSWREAVILSSPDYQSDPRYAHWIRNGASLSIRSTMSIPLLGENKSVSAVLSLYGEHINQFEAPMMRQFARGLQSRWSRLLRRANAPNRTITQERAAELRHHLFTGGLRMYAQPIVDAASTGVFKAEALARLEMPDGTILAPGAFLPILGKGDLNHLFRLSLGIALDHLLAWERQGIRGDISVNMPPSALHDEGCVASIEHALRVRGITPSRLTLEFLEAQDLDVTGQSAAISALKRLGVCIAIDDLGSGYSSLQRMASLPFDIVKVDQSIVRQIYRNPLSILSMLDMFVRMGRDLHLSVVVEGLEDEGMIEAARILGAEMMQGYGLGRPMPAVDFVAWANSHSLPSSNAAIQTPLGVLAYCWAHLRRPMTPFQRDEAVVMLLDICERLHIHQVVEFLRSRSLRALPREILTQLAQRVSLDDLQQAP